MRDLANKLGARARWCDVSQKVAHDKRLMRLTHCRDDPENDGGLGSLMSGRCVDQFGLAVQLVFDLKLI